MKQEVFYFKVVTDKEIRVYNDTYTTLIKNTTYKVRLVNTDLEKDLWRLELLNLAGEVLIRPTNIEPRKASIDSSIQSIFFDVFTFWEVTDEQLLWIPVIEKKKLVEEIPPIVINCFKKKGIRYEEL